MFLFTQITDLRISRQHLSFRVTPAGKVLVTQLGQNGALISRSTRSGDPMVVGEEREIVPGDRQTYRQRLGINQNCLFRI